MLQMKKLIGPFSQIVTLRGLPLKGPLPDSKLEVIPNGGVVVKDGCIKAVGDIKALIQLHHDAVVETVKEPAVLLPGFIDCHTHMCFAGKRSADYALRIAGESYLDIALSGGGIWNTVQATRNTSEAELLALVVERIHQHVASGITTIEIKSGYGLNVESELKMLRVINMAAAVSETSVISTCLAAHINPKDFNGDDKNYLQFVVSKLLPILKEKKAMPQGGCICGAKRFL